MREAGRQIEQKMPAVAIQSKITTTKQQKLECTSKDYIDVSTYDSLPRLFYLTVVCTGPYLYNAKYHTVGRWVGG